LALEKALFYGSLIIDKLCSVKSVGHYAQKPEPKEQNLTSSKNKKMKKTMASKKAPAKKPVAKKPLAKKTAVKKAVVARKPVDKKLIEKKLKVIQQRSMTAAAPVAVAKPVEVKSSVTPMVIADNDNVDFTKGDYVVYPAHGVGQIEGVETHTIGGMQIRLYAVSFEKERMRLKIPVMKAKTSGLRKLCSNKRLKDAIETLQGRARIRRTMWSRRAQEYETKINSGDPVAIAEVLRDLKRSNDDSEQSYSERQIYQSALERLAREFAAIKGVTEIKATEQLEGILGTLKKKEAA
jgi:CarD family transcriptional regulator